MDEQVIFLVVLDDGRTFSGLYDCKIVLATTESVEKANDARDLKIVKEWWVDDFIPDNLIDK